MNRKKKLWITLICGILLLLTIFRIPQIGVIVLISGGVWYLYKKVRYIKL